jgi:hypothetical protein
MGWWQIVDFLNHVYSILMAAKVGLLKNLTLLEPDGWQKKFGLLKTFQFNNSKRMMNF